MRSAQRRTAISGRAVQKMLRLVLALCLLGQVAAHTFQLSDAGPSHQMTYVDVGTSDDPAPNPGNEVPPPDRSFDCAAHSCWAVAPTLQQAVRLYFGGSVEAGKIPFVRATSVARLERPPRS